MSWAKHVDRTKFNRNGMVISSFNQNARKWFCAYWHDQDSSNEPNAAGEGDDPFEAMLHMCIDLGALAETGEWKP